MHKKATKNTSAVPKSLISARQPMQKPLNSTVKMRFRLANSRSNVALPTSTKANFTNSDGWELMGPMETQFFAPKIRCPNSRLKASSPAASAATTHRSCMDRGRLRSTMLMNRNSAMPSSTVASSFSSVAGE